MRSKLPSNAFFEFRAHEKGLIRRSNQLLGISTSWKMTKNSTSWKNEFRTHEIRPPDPESLVQGHFLNFRRRSLYAISQHNKWKDKKSKLSKKLAFWPSQQILSISRFGRKQQSSELKVGWSNLFSTFLKSFEKWLHTDQVAKQGSK
jgi:hypothetical protein